MSKGFAGGVPVVRMLQHLGCRVLPIGAEAGSDRLLVIAAAQRATGLCATPNFALYLGEQADRVLGRPASETGIRRLIVGGEPGGGIPALRSRLEATWQATSCEVLGNSDIATIVWAECEQAHDGMHFIGQGLVLAELIDPTSGQVVEARSGLRAEIVYTALVREASPLLRFRSRDHVEIIGTECECGRTSLRLRCFGRTDDMLIVKGVNVWPTAVQELVLKFRPRTTGAMRIILDFPGHATSGPLRVRIEHAANLSDQERADLRDDIARQIRQLLIIRAEVELVPPDTLEKPGATKVSLVVRELGSAT
jgi:phenylacetate-CoA ligase